MTKVKMTQYKYIQGQVIKSNDYIIELANLKAAKTYINCLNPRAQREAVIVG